MFSSTGFSKANAYRQVGVHSGIENASPHTLIQMLFDALETSLNAAKGAMQRGDIEEKGRQIGKAVRILEEGLKASLNLNQGGEVAQAGLAHDAGGAHDEYGVRHFFTMGHLDCDSGRNALSPGTVATSL